MEPAARLGNIGVYKTKVGVFTVAPQYSRWLFWSVVTWVSYGLLRFALGPLTGQSFFEVSLLALLALAALSQVLCILTTCTDPGILPQLSDKPEGVQDNECHRPNEVLEFVNVAVANNNIIDQSMCYKCGHLKPRGTNHCFMSNACIMDMDHYCIILGCAIGSRNLRWFLLYLLTLSVGGTLGVVTSFKGLKGSAVSGRHHDSVLLIFVSLVAIGGVAVGMVTYFFGKGMYLLWNGQTTRGIIKKIAVSSDAKRGIEAVKQVLFPQIPSLLPMYLSNFQHANEDDDEDDPVADRVEI